MEIKIFKPLNFSMEAMSNESYIKKDHNYASKNLANTALGFGIAGTALGLLNSGFGMFGYGHGHGRGGHYTDEEREITQLERKECKDYIEITKEFYEGKLSNLRELTTSFYDLDQKIQAAKDKAAFENRVSFDELNKRIIDLEKTAAVQAATAPLLQIITDMKINGVAGSSMSAVALEAERRESAISLEAERRNCADNKIVNYVNSTFYPQYIANITTDSTVTPERIYNPLATCQCGR